MTMPCVLTTVRDNARRGTEMRARRLIELAAAGGLLIGLAACGAAAHPVIRDPAQVTRALQRQGYRRTREVHPRPGSGEAALYFGSDPRYGQPVAQYEKNGLDVLVLRVGPNTKRLPPPAPGYYWYRSGDVTVFASSATPRTEQWEQLLGAI